MLQQILSVENRFLGTEMNAQGPGNGDNLLHVRNRVRHGNALLMNDNGRPIRKQARDSSAYPEDPLWEMLACFLNDVCELRCCVRADCSNLPNPTLRGGSHPQTSW